MSSSHATGDQGEWPVLVFRRTMAKGWELFYQPTSDKEKSEPETVTAAPRRGCVEVRKLRLRIHLFKQLPKNNRGAIKGQEVSTVALPNNSGSTAADGNNNTLVVRRKDTILLSTRRGMGAVVLKFRNRSDCLSFSDRLVELNTEYAPTSSESHRRDGQSSAVLESRPSRPQIHQNFHRPEKKRKLTEGGAQMVTASQSSSSTSSLSSSSKTAAESSQSSDDISVSESRRKREVLSYIVRLLHDDNFLGFVDEIEGSLASSPDCVGILSALGQNRPPRINL